MKMNPLTPQGLLRPQIFVAGIFFISLLFQGWCAQGQSLETYIEEAYKNNPDIRVTEKRYDISVEKISEVNTLANTEFSAGYMAAGNQKNMMQQSQYAVMQMFPWFGTIPARTKYATAVADADFAEVEIAKRKIALALSQSWYRLQEIREKQQVLDSNLQLLKVYERMALTSVEVGKASAVSVLRLQMRQNDLVEKKLILGQDYAAELTSFNRIMNRSQDTDVRFTEPLSVPQSETKKDLENLEIHPELSKFEELNRVIDLAEELNKKERAPEFGLGIEYLQFNRNPNMVMPMVSVSVPIFNNRYKSISRQNRLRHEELAIQKQGIRNSLITELQTAIRNRNAARISLETQEKNVRQAEHANEILLRNYETGTIDFREVLDVQELLLELQLNRIEAASEYFRQKSIIDYYTGGITR